MTELIGFDSASSSQVPRTVEENISRGRAAMRVVLKTKQDFDHAMYRQDMGWIDFVWGDAGKVRPNGKTKGGKGIVHILEARMRKDGYSATQAHALVYRMVSTLAKGNVIRQEMRNGAINKTIEYQGYEAILVKNFSNSWLLSGWKVFD